MYQVFWYGVVSLFWFFILSSWIRQKLFGRQPALLVVQWKAHLVSSILAIFALIALWGIVQVLIQIKL